MSLLVEKEEGIKGPVVTCLNGFKMRVQFLLTLALVAAFVAPTTAQNVAVDEMDQQQTSIGVADFIALIPGIHKVCSSRRRQGQIKFKSEVCSMCKRVLTAVKRQGVSRANQDQTQLRAIVDVSYSRLQTTYP